jgi:putative sigma-54 modulation protein
MMELNITAKNIELTPTVRQLIESKLGKLGRHLPDIREYKVEISRVKTKATRELYVVQATIDSHGTLLRGAERGEDLPAAINKVASVINRQIERFKGKLYAKGRGTSPAKSEIEEEPPPAGRVVKVKRFNVKPMSAAEAIDQMELLGHDFFLFFNADSEELNLLYRRHDGDYGLIEPEMG